MVADDVLERGRFGLALHLAEVEEAFSALGLLRDLVRGQGAVEFGSDGRGVHHLALRFAGVDGHALDGDRGGRRVEGLVLEFTQRAAVDGVRHIGAELVEVEERGAFADLLVRRERDGDAAVFVRRIAEQHLGHRHDLRDTGLVVGAE